MAHLDKRYYKRSDRRTAIGYIIVCSCIDDDDVDEGDRKISLMNSPFASCQSVVKGEWVHHHRRRCRCRRRRRRRRLHLPSSSSVALFRAQPFQRVKI